MSYIIIFKEPLTGKIKYYKTFRKHKDAQQAANELRFIIDSGKLPEPIRVKLNPLTFQEVAEKFRQEWDERHKRNDLANKTFREYSIWLNVLIEDFHFHDLRHTFCSNLLLAGASLKDAKELTGHEDITMTDRYSHLTFQHRLSKQEQLANHYNNG